MALRSPEVRVLNRLHEHGYTLKELLRAIGSPVFSEIIVVLSGRDACRSPMGMAGALRKMHEIKFRLIFFVWRRQRRWGCRICAL